MILPAFGGGFPAPFSGAGGNRKNAVWDIYEKFINFCGIPIKYGVK